MVPIVRIALVSGQFVIFFEDRIEGRVFFRLSGECNDRCGATCDCASRARLPAITYKSMGRRVSKRLS